MPPTWSPADADFNYLPNYLQLAALLAEVSRLHSFRVILASEVGSAACYLRYDLGAAALLLVRWVSLLTKPFNDLSYSMLSLHNNPGVSKTIIYYIIIIQMNVK